MARSNGLGLTLGTLLGVLMGMSLGMLPVSALGAPDTLVVKQGEGYGAGAAKSWTASDGGIVFELVDGVDAQAVAKTLTDRLFGAKVAVAGARLTVSGIPSESLLEQLATLSLSGQGDPLAGLDLLGGAAVAMELPSGGGSIRASKPGMNSLLPKAISGHDKRERWVAEVVEVKRASFPLATLKVRVRRPSREGPAAKLRRGEVVEGPVVLGLTKSGIDFRDVSTQRNVGAYYLNPGDRVHVHALETADGGIEFDYVERY